MCGRGRDAGSRRGAAHPQAEVRRRDLSLNMTGGPGSLLLEGDDVRVSLLSPLPGGTEKEIGGEATVPRPPGRRRPVRAVFCATPALPVGLPLLGLCMSPA